MAWRKRFYLQLMQWEVVMNSIRRTLERSGKGAWPREKIKEGRDLYSGEDGVVAECLI